MSARRAGAICSAVTAAAALDLLPRPLRQRVTGAPALAAKLDGWYATPPRHYHTLAHVAAMLREWRALRDAGVPGAREAPATWAAAILFHDAVYAAGRPDNERESAALARAHGPLHFPALDPDAAARWIELTALHGGALPAGLTEAERLFLDVDMAVLGAEPAAYDAYAAGVRAEYMPVVGEAAYRAGRAAFLERAAAAPRLYLTGTMHARYDARARANMARELAALRGTEASGAAG